MTCIVGIAREGRVFMGADSCAGGDADTWSLVDNPKVFKVDDRFLIGCCGSFRLADLLRFSLRVGDQPPGLCDDEFMRTVFIAAIRACFVAGTVAEEDRMDSPFLVGYRGGLYEVQADNSVLNLPAWGFSLGSGEGPARGSLWTTRRLRDTQKRLRKALEAAEATISNVRGPFRYLVL